MTPTLLLSLALLPAQSASLQDRERHPLAPSLPVLTRGEEDAIESVIERFIKAETGNAPASQIEKAKKELYRLGPEAVFVLIDGLNRAANIEASCPSVTLRNKVKDILARSTDVELMKYARENVGAGVTAPRFKAMLADLRVFAAIRQGQVARLGNALPAGNIAVKPLSTMPTADLVSKVNRDRGAELQNVLKELGKRKDLDALNGLALATKNADRAAQSLARQLLEQGLKKGTSAELKAALKTGRAEVRVAAVREVSSRKLPWTSELISLLTAADADVQQTARQALITLAGGQDFGPEATASPAERAAAAQRWRERFGVR